VVNISATLFAMGVPVAKTTPPPAFNQAVQPTGASRLTHRQMERQGRLRWLTLVVMSSKRKRLLVIIGGTVGCLYIVGYLVSRHLEKVVTALDTLDITQGGHATIEQLVSYLDYSNILVLKGALSELEFRRSDAGRERAAQLLQHRDLYVWYCASLYLGAIGDQRSVPYLIRGLDHLAWRHRPKLLGYLRSLTHQDFGENKDAWIQWWTSQHPGSSFDFTTKRT